LTTIVFGLLIFLQPLAGAASVVYLIATWAIDLRGTGKRSIRMVDFWYDTKGLLNGKAEVKVYGMK
jgi:hypothetical protein